MRALRPLLFAAALAVPAPAQSAPPTPAPQEPERHLVEVRVTGPAQMQRLLRLELDLASCRHPLPGQRRIEVIATDDDLQRMQQAGFAPRVLMRDLAAHYARELARFPVANLDDLTPPIGQGAMGGHYTLAQMEAILDAFQQQFPQLCSQKVSIGQSVEGRAIWMVKISDNVGVDENEPEVLYDALHHAREPLSLGATLLFMDELLTGYGTDPEATFLIDEREFYFVPCLNPDGYEYNRQTNPGGGGLWRKNRRLNGNNTYGVDLNRNYATAWSAPNGGSSATPSSETYRGTGAFSEPETQAIEAFAASRQFVQVFSTHTYTDVLLRPWGWQNGDPANVADYDVMGAFMVQENGVAHGSISGLLYIASGSAVDHHHTVRGSYSWTAELGRSNEGGFWPAGPNIEAIARRHQPMFRKIALTAGAALSFSGVTVTEAPGGNGNGTVEPGESGEVVFTLDNAGMANALAVAVALTPVSPGLGIGSGSANFAVVPRFGSAGNAGAPLTFTVPAGYASPVASLRLQAVHGTHTVVWPLDLLLVPSRLLADDDFERDRGFARAPVGTATTGLWERSAPQATSNGGVTIQPGFQTTPGGSLCWVTDGRAGTGAGTYDVDGGYTDLLSPTIDLRHAAFVEATFQLWYAESAANDACEISVSRDGGTNWSTVWSTSSPTGAYLQVTADLGSPLTDQMRVRVRAQDLNASLVEALVDDFLIRGVAADGATTVLASGVLGSDARVGMTAPAGALLFPLGSLALGGGISFPGVQGTLLLDPSLVVVLPVQAVGAAGYVAFDLALPANPGLVGLSVHFQAGWMIGGTAAFGGNTGSVTLQ